MRTLLVRTLPLILLAAFVSCSDDPSDGGDGAADVTEDPAADTTPDADLPDAGDDSDDDAETDGSGDDADAGDDAEAGACSSDDDCDEGSFCISGRCNDLSCRAPEDWVECQDWYNEIEDDLGRFAICREGQCELPCQFDEECADGETCADFGQCVPFTGTLGPGTAGESTGTLRAGVSNVLMDYPIGVPLGGYGERAAFQDGRYAVSLRASAGAVHGLYARAVALDNGTEEVVLVRLPLIFIGDQLHEDISRALQAETGDDWRDNLIISTTHTHSGPCRHWHLPPEPATPLGSFGIGEFHQWFYDLVLASTLEAVRAARADLSPAKIGWTIVEAFDVDDQIGRDRWRATPPFDDNRALVIRIDDMNDVPRAVLFSFGAHGTDNGSDYASGDSLAGAERGFEARIGEEFGVFAPALYFNQNSGSMSPAASSRGHDFPQTIERMGYAFLERVYDDYENIETTDQLTMGSSTLRFPLGYDIMGYDRDQFAATFPPPLGGEYSFGGISCSGRVGGDSDPETYDSLEDLTCAGALQFLLNNTPPSMLQRSQTTAMTLNGLTIQTMPGELSMELSWQILRALRDEHGVDPLSAWTFGYAQDHLFYLLPTNLRGELPPFPGISTPMPPDDYPDFAFSYLQGGYEASMSPWGPNLGDYLVARAVENYGRLIDPAAEIAVPPVLPQQLSPRDMGTFAVDVTPAERVAEIIEPMPEQVERFETIEFAWIGGDPGAEMPQVPEVLLQRQVGEAWEAVITPSTLPYSNREPLFMTRVRQNVDTGLYEWVVRWEELGEFPTGTYRLRVRGNVLTAAETIEPYELTSAPFDMVPSSALVAEFSGLEDTSAVVHIGYPRDERMRFSSFANDPGEVTGNYRMRHPLVPNGFPAPLAETVTAEVEVTVGGDAVFVLDAEDLRVQTRFEQVDGRDGTPQSYLLFDTEVVGAGTHTATVRLEDAAGNIGETSFEFTVP